MDWTVVLYTVNYELVEFDVVCKRQKLMSSERFSATK